MPPMRGHESVREWVVAFAKAKQRRLLQAMERATKRRRGETAEGFYRCCLHRGDLAFDIGAHKGHHTAAMLKCGARVIALEPQRVLAEQLAREFPKATVLPVAVGAEPGTATLATSSACDEFATLSTAWTETEPEGTWDGSERVPVTTVEDLIGEYGQPMMLKVDTEGFEDAVFARLTVPVEHILFEVHESAPAVATRVFDRLALLDQYDFTVMSRESWGFGPRVPAEQILENLPNWGDVYARRRG